MSVCKLTVRQCLPELVIIDILFLHARLFLARGNSHFSLHPLHPLQPLSFFFSKLRRQVFGRVPKRKILTPHKYIPRSLSPLYSRPTFRMWPPAQIIGMKSEDWIWGDFKIWNPQSPPLVPIWRIAAFEISNTYLSCPPPARSGTDSKSIWLAAFATGRLEEGVRYLRWS